MIMLKRILISLLTAMLIVSGCEKPDPVPTPPTEEATEPQEEQIDPENPEEPGESGESGEPENPEEPGEPGESGDSEEPSEPSEPEWPEEPDSPDDFPFEAVTGTEETFSFDKLMTVGEISQLLPIYALGSLYGVENYMKKKDSSVAYKTLVLKYLSSDSQGRPVWLSGRIYYSCSSSGRIKRPDHILLYNHYTISSDAECPSNDHMFHACLAINGGLVVCPDFIGYGATKDMDHPYCIPDVTAINALDMVRAARAYFSSKGVSLSQNIPFYNIGYSQGGFSSLVVHKYIETHNLLDEFNLKASYCGGGPYSEETMFLKYMDDDWCSFPLAVPMSIIGLKTAYPDIMTEPVENYFSDAFLKTGLLDVLRSKETNYESFNKLMSQALNPGGDGGVKVSAVAAPSVISRGKLFKQIDEALKRNELAVAGDGWKPEKYVHFMHDVNDEVVPYVNFTLAKSNLSNSNTYFETIDFNLLQGHIYICGLFFARNITGQYKK